VLERPDLAADPRWSTNSARTAGRGQLEPILEEIIGRLDVIDLQERLDRADLPWGHVRTIADVARHPQLAERDRWYTTGLDNSAEGEVLKSPFLVDGQSIAPRSVPAHGEHTEVVLIDLGYGAEEIEVMLRDGAVAGRGTSERPISRSANARAHG
jgi:crotonobetainyl-CoA:carnitine CoA-transferase CaiB-like acyl-CoA transferase